MKKVKINKIKPNNWLYTKMTNDLVDGYVGKLDQLVPSLLVDDDIYRRNRLGMKLEVKKLGVVEEEVEGSLQLQWWNSESQSQWYDGLIRHIIMLDEECFDEKLESYIKRMLSYQDSDGYMGIYTKEKRFNFSFESGELWALTTLLRGLLAYNEAFDSIILSEIMQALAALMKGYPINNSNPFKYEQTHGLMIVDVLYEVYKLSDDFRYINYAKFIYDNYNENDVSEKDAQLNNLCDNEYRFESHGVHTYEHLRVVAIIAHYFKGQYLDAYNGFITKLDNYLLPSKACVGDEWILNRHGDATMTGYEFCSLQELLHSYTTLYELNPNKKFLEDLEWLYYNAALGSMHPSKHAITYLNTDNCYSLNGGFQFEQPNSPHSNQTRYKYSGVHQDVAVCCVPNAGRITPYLLQAMWFEDENKIFKTIYGPSIYQDKGLTITEDSSFPYDLNLKYDVDNTSNEDFIFILRKPDWAISTFIDGKEVKDLEVTIKANTKTSYQVNFNVEIIKHSYNNEYYFSYGPLVYALPIEYQEQEVDKYQDEIKDYYYQSLNDEHLDLVLSDDTYYLDGNDIVVNLYNTKTSETKSYHLKPMAELILRKVTFGVK